jgi:acyl-coenzyme A thioesterase PaaI-like protein
MKLAVHVIGTEDSVRGKSASFVLQLFVHEPIGVGTRTLAQCIATFHEGHIAALLNVASAFVCASRFDRWCMSLGVVMTLRVSWKSMSVDEYFSVLPFLLPTTPVMAEAHVSAVRRKLRILIVCIFDLWMDGEEVVKEGNGEHDISTYSIIKSRL